MPPTAGSGWGSSVDWLGAGDGMLKYLEPSCFWGGKSSFRCFRVMRARSVWARVSVQVMAVISEMLAAWQKRWLRPSGIECMWSVLGPLAAACSP
jgi:hypothetical protein